MDRNFTPEAPNAVWASDITYISTKEGWLYLAVTMALFAKTIGGWSMDHTMTAELPLGALNMAVSRRNPPAGLIHYSDRGSGQASVLPKKLVRQPPVSNCFKGQRDAVQHKSEGGLLGQCRGRELFRDLEA
ncbi:DDE-type integrase/transposase/recombinase [Deinococcus xinjiangensis]|uniref:DDE-type integrase/transposase/recombinase n=1 Tax=Deinococcus xinjiangensis TaxID=457454 RepID=UPI00336586A4